MTASGYRSKACKKGGFLGTAMWRIPVTKLGAGQLTFDWLLVPGATSARSARLKAPTARVRTRRRARSGLRRGEYQSP